MTAPGCIGHFAAHCFLWTQRLASHQPSARSWLLDCASWCKSSFAQRIITPWPPGVAGTYAFERVAAVSKLPGLAATMDDIVVLANLCGGLLCNQGVRMVLMRGRGWTTGSRTFPCLATNVFAVLKRP